MELGLIINAGFKSEEDYFRNVSEISRFRRDFIKLDAMNRLRQLHPNCHVIFWIDLIDNRDIGYGMTYRGFLGVYSTSERNSNCLLGGFGDSSPWCFSIEEAEEKAVIDYLHKERINSAYRNKEDSWRRILL